jgi:hypothetical protein
MLEMLAVAVFSLSLAGCRSWAPTSEATEGGQFKPEGRILVQGTLRGPSVSFDEDRVIGPTINMSRQWSGDWVGWIRGSPLNLHIEPGKIASSTLSMNIQESPEGVEISGLWASHQISMRVTPKELYVREPFVQPPVYLAASGRAGIYGTGLFGETVELKGMAALPQPPEPQFALALLGAF